MSITLSRQTTKTLKHNRLSVLARSDVSLLAPSDHPIASSSQCLCAMPCLIGAAAGKAR